MTLVDFILHIDKYFGAIISTYGTLSYLVLFLIVFIETGIIIMPFLPGDSLLFAAGAFASIKSLNIILILVIAGVAAILGDSLNYLLGKKLGRKIFTKENSKLFNKEYLYKTERFYEKYGAKTIFLARFVPIIRTFAPFVAGMGKMKYGKFLAYNIFGGIIWVSLFSLAGYYFGNIPLVKDNFGMVIIVIIILSLMPLVIEIIKSRKK